MRRLVVVIIRFYQKVLSPDSGLPYKLGLTRNVCCMYPKCSDYTISAVLKYGVIKGVYFGGKRILRCHPWQKNRIDELN